MLTLLTALSIAGCGGGGGDGGTSPQANPPPVTGANASPTIQGRPGTAVTVGEAYTFQAIANDANGDTLTFSAANLPGWLSLSPSTGRITGSPTAGDVGAYQGITISVSDGQATASLASFAINVSAVATGSATLSWVTPTLNTDGSSLIDLAGFKILYGRSADDLTQAVSITNPSLSSYVLENLGSGAWFFAVVAVNSAGLESMLSSIATKTIA
ncbi:putative Ig domain-containing protein [Povalibacter sp.]|uniref:putative Ig domain-containing protein n=1 Tax=Povalibacter sp. TaxID=1962978 RepID=UPI002F3FE5BA